jgi:ATP-dependent exoDNAse (exonuclease V) beta subunit
VSDNATPGLFPVGDQVILASAGSGKTFALSDRIIKILAYQQIQEGCIKPDQIVALTFTRAAAGEFVAKTLDKLAKAAKTEAEATKIRNRLKLPVDCDLKFFRRLLRDTLLSMHRLTLGTLDSFFARLVSNNPTEVGLDGGRLRNIGELEAGDIRAAVISRMMAETPPEEVEEVRALLLDLNQGKDVATPLKGLAETVESLHDLATLAKDASVWGDSSAIWEKFPPIFAPQDAGQVADASASFVDWVNQETFHGSFRNSLRSVAVAVAGMADASTLTDSQWNLFLSYLREITLGKDGQAGTAIYPNGSKGKTIKFTAQACDDLRTLARHAFGFAMRTKQAQTKAIHKLITRYESIYDREVRRRGSLTFSDNVTLLLKADGKFNIDYRLDCSVKHWLFDEFQDTSTRQFLVLKENLENILGVHAQKEQGKTAFFVGDLKQSLYGWRAGNPELLRQIDAKIPKKPEDDMNFTRRCAQPIVELVNGLLGDLTSQGVYFSPDAATKWAKVWKNHSSRNEDHPEIGEALWVRLVAPKAEEEAGSEADLESDSAEEDGGDGEGTPATRAGAQAKWIGAHIRESGMLDDKGLLKPGLTCAILVSKNRQAAEITEELRRMGIEAADEADTEVAMDNPFTAGIVSLIKSAAHPSDRLSKGMAEMAPAAKAYVDTHGGWPEARLRIARLFYTNGGEAVLQDIIKGHLPAGATNGERFLLKRVDQLLGLAVKFDEDATRDIGSFATHLEGSALRDTADPRSVQVLTVHRSKGLQYTAVYLPCLNDKYQKIAGVRVKNPIMKTAEDFTPRWILSRPKTSVCEADPETLGQALIDERTDAAYENLCRLYVGMTRAIRRLVLVTDAIEKGGGASLRTPNNHGKFDFAMLVESVCADSPHKPANPSLKLKGVEEAEIMVRHGDESWIGHAAKTAATAEPKTGRDISQLVPVRRTGKIRPSKSGEPVEGGWSPRKDNVHGKALGTATHDLFKLLEWDLADFESKLEQAKPTPELVAIHEEAIRLIRDCVSEGAVRELLLGRPNGTILWNERNATLLHEGKAVNAVFDRVHVVPGESAVVIDYKTNQGAPAKLKDLYQDQMDLYRIAVAKLCGLSPEKVRCVLVHVRLGALVEC